MTGFAVLVGHDVVPVEDLTDPRSIAMWHDPGSRRVALDTVDVIEVSTVFLGIDHGSYLGMPPLWFETMTFGPVGDFTWRYTTWEQAEAGHAAVVAALRAGADLDSLEIES